MTVPAVTADVAAETRLRADARENRDRIIAVARQLFAARGLDVPMAAIARQAEVGMATLYRRFPTRQDLLAEVFADQFAECAAIVERAVSDPDPWRGLCAAVAGLAAMQAADHGFSTAFVRDLPDASVVDQKLQQGAAGFQRLIDRAKRSGQLRPDFAFEDLALILMANGGVVGLSPRPGAASQRFIGYMLDAFRADAVPRRRLPPSVPTDLARIAFPAGT